MKKEGLIMKQKQPFEPPKFKTLIPFLLLAVAIIAAYKIINETNFLLDIVNRIWSIISPFFYGLLIAYILNIPCAGIQKLFGKPNKIKKALSIAIVYLLFGLVIFAVLYLVIPYISNTAYHFVNNFDTYYNSVAEFINYINDLEFFGLSITTDDIINVVKDFGLTLENLTASVNMILSVSSSIFVAFVAFISSIYMLFEKEKFIEFMQKTLKAFCSDSVYDIIIKYSGRLNKNFRQYIYTQTIDGLILGTVATIELYILRSPYAAILGIMLGVVNYIPYFGSIFGSLIAVLIVAFTQGITMGAIAALILLITQQLDGNVLQPKLMGSSFSLSPLLVIISVTVGGALAGIFGMLVAIPIVAVLKDVLDSITYYQEQKKVEKSDGMDTDENKHT